MFEVVNIGGPSDSGADSDIYVRKLGTTPKQLKHLS